jgi:hypothetical protein
LIDRQRWFDPVKQKDVAADTQHKSLRALGLRKNSTLHRE